ncbi:hypothetical protein J8273_8113 [Carpediemonas membranifera]|uniref:Uncharacterized protein n=1 Tax=Carpediemonas membranifera TaxID=201153 RepID=A0A8J6APL1_9EUKA|nr:hypothetical protein J8273_8113 [Carpediemonas membranifera]|eukprot:KAG9390076.1 hypothetical protein J8273_8113 [Carpediemonas membranifera]
MPIMPPPSTRPPTHAPTPQPRLFPLDHEPVEEDTDTIMDPEPTPVREGEMPAMAPPKVSAPQVSLDAPKLQLNPTPKFAPRQLKMPQFNAPKTKPVDLRPLTLAKPVPPTPKQASIAMPKPQLKVSMPTNNFALKFQRPRAPGNENTPNSAPKTTPQPRQAPAPAPQAEPEPEPQPEEPAEPAAPALGTDDWAGLRTDTTVAMADVTKRVEDTFDHEKLYRQQKELMAITAEFGEVIERMEDTAVRLVLQNNGLLFKLDPQLESRMKEMRRKYCS